eukprot:Trichotokara_eunicae@DN5819_c0_g1_i2.p1
MVGMKLSEVPPPCVGEDDSIRLDEEDFLFLKKIDEWANIRSGKSLNDGTRIAIEKKLWERKRFVRDSSDDQDYWRSRFPSLIPKPPVNDGDQSSLACDESCSSQMGRSNTETSLASGKPDEILQSASVSGENIVADAHNADIPHKEGQGEEKSDVPCGGGNASKTVG